MRNTHAKGIPSSRRLWLLPLFASLACLFAFTGKTSGRAAQHTGIVTIANDTPHIKYFSKVDVKKTTGNSKAVVLNDVRLFIINGRRYQSAELLYKYNGATLKADEMRIVSPNDENALGMYGDLAAKGIVEFRNATIIPPMINAKNKPLFLLDGLEVENLQFIKSFDPNILKGISFFKDVHNTTEKHGTKAKYGVVEILTWRSEASEVMAEGTKDEGIMVPPVDESRGVVEPVVDDPNKIWERVEIDAMFKGGESAWKKYLEDNLDKNVPKRNGAPAATYTAWVQFIVEKDGTLADIKVLSAHGYGIEEEAMRLIKTTTDRSTWKTGDNTRKATDSKWVAAIQNGRTVRSYKKQAITFVVE